MKLKKMYKRFEMRRELEDLELLALSSAQYAEYRHLRFVKTSNYIGAAVFIAFAFIFMLNNMAIWSLADSTMAMALLAHTNVAICRMNTLRDFALLKLQQHIKEAKGGKNGRNKNGRAKSRQN